ncbi:glycine cleavage system H-protein subunit [Cladophialophora chaetospira]|uniref:Glycine cleavage system H protein n=1 Tax=Cladophialophora chaetospira TaxID=386627 RepID=A0AA38WZU3_9EURO|nr:glycine cleavage system H-protein subunit [Cladophialophora chaetospira]
MSPSTVSRVVPAVTKLATTKIALPRSSLRSNLLRWQQPQRPFSARSPLLVKKYTEDHEWIELDSDGKTGTIGITEYAAKALGDVVYVELPEIGMDVAKGDTIGAVESVKSASDIMTPVSGKISDHNKLLEEKPGTINKSPESEGWLAKIEVTELNELDALMSKEDYDKFEKE